MEPSEAAAVHGLLHRVAGLSSGAGLHLGHAELRLQEQVQAAVGQQQRVQHDPEGETQAQRASRASVAAGCHVAADVPTEGVVAPGLKGTSDSPVSY